MNSYEGYTDDQYDNVTLLLHADDFTDSSKYGATMTNAGAATIDTTTNKFGTGSFSFSGTATSYLQTPLSTNYSFGSSNFTMEFWFNSSFPTTNYNYYVFGNNTSGSVANGWLLYFFYSGTSTLTVYLRRNNANPLSYLFPTVPSGWNHYTLVRNGNTISFYYNGVSVASYTESGSIDNGIANLLYIGAAIASDASSTLKGYIDEVRITKGVARYISNFTVPNAPFFPVNVNYTPLAINDPYWANTTLLLHGDNFTDLSRIGATMTTGSVTISPTKKFGSGSFSFDGTTNSYIQTPSSTNYGFGSGDFTIEFWIYFNSITVPLGITGNPTGLWTNNRWMIVINDNSGSGGMVFGVFSPTLNLLIPATFATGTWYHIAYSRSGNTFYGFLNGALAVTTSYSSAIDNGSSNQLTFGWNTIDNKLNGFIDDLRITKGVARYTSNFTTDRMIVGDPYFNSTVLLLNANDFTDSSNYNATMTNTGATINTTTRKFGTGSFQFSSTGYLLTPKSTLYGLGTSDWTIEFWVYFTSTPDPNAHLFSSIDTTWSPGNWVIRIRNVPANGRIAFYGNSQASFAEVASDTTLNTWQHVAFVRNGSSLLAFQNGTLTATYSTYFSTNTSLDTSNVPINIGVDKNGGTCYLTNSFFDDIRITKGIARYTAAFTVPSGPFTNIQASGFNSLEYVTANTYIVSYQPYGNGQYVARASSTLGSTNYEWYAFDKTNATNASSQLSWANGSTTAYTAATGAYTTGFSTTVSGTAYAGEWLQLQTPAPLRVTRYSLTSPNHTANTFMGTPGSWVLAGSNDATTWWLLDKRDSQMFTSSNQTLSYNVSIPNANTYSYVRMCVTKAQTPTGGNYLHVGELSLFSDTQVTQTALEWPPSALIANTTTFSSLAYGNGTYVATGSSEYSNNPTSFGFWLAFNKAVPTTDQWIAGLSYNANGTVNASSPTVTISGTSYQGEYIVIHLPSPINLSRYTLTSISRSDVGGGYWRRTPYTWTLGGSNDKGASWIQIDSQSAQLYSGYNQVKEFMVPSNITSYSSYILTIQNIQPTQQTAPSDTLVSIGELRFFGTPVTQQNYMYIDGSGNDQAPSITLDTIGNQYLLVSNVQTTGSIFNLNGAPSHVLPVTSNRSTLVKYDTSGVVQWRTSWGGIASSSLTPNSPSATTSWGDTVCTDTVLNGTLTFYNANDTTGGTLTLANAWSNPILVEYNSAGVYQWSNWIPTTTPGAVSQSCAVDSVGSVYVTGRSSAGVIMYPGTGITIPASSGTGAFLVKYNSAGVCQWASRGVDGTGGDAGTMVVTDRSNVYLSTITVTATATVYNSDGTTFGTTIPSSTNTRAVIKYNGAGFGQFVVCIAGDATSTTGTGAVIDSAQNIYVWGQKNTGTSLIYNAGAVSSGTSIPATTGIGAYVVKYNSVGTYQWYMYIDGAGTDIVTGIDVDQFGTVYICGQSSTGGGTIYTSSGTTGFTMPVTTTPQMFLVTFTSTGALSTFKYGVTTGTALTTNTLAVDKSAMKVYATGTVTAGNLTLNNYSNVTLTQTPTLVNQGVYVVTDTPGVEWPPAALTANASLMTNQSYGNGQYYASASSMFGIVDMAPWYTFNKDQTRASGYGWTSAGGYNASGVYAGTVTTTVSGTAYTGEWLQLQSPVPFVLSSYSFKARVDATYYTQFPGIFLVAGSNDGTTWSLIDTRNNVSVVSGGTYVYNVQSTTSYIYFRIISRTTLSIHGAVGINLVSFFGLPTYTQVQGDPYFNNTVLLLHADGSSGTITSVTDNSPSPKTITVVGTASQSQYSSTQRKFGPTSFYFAGYTTQNNNIKASNVPGFGSGDFTIEFWIYIDEANFNTQRRVMGNSVSSSGGFTWEIGWFQNPPFINTSVGQCQLGTVSVQTWVYITFVKSGSNMLGFVNGTLTTTTSLSSSTVDAGGNYDVNIGGVGFTSTNAAAFVGYIDDVRITKGVARYTSNFVVPGFAFPDMRGTVVEWPPAAMTSDSSTINGFVYTSSVSSYYTNSVNYAAFRAFDKATVTNGATWVNFSPTAYDATTGTYSAGIYSTNGIPGEWLQITLPFAITLTSYSIVSIDSLAGNYNRRLPSTWTVLGSNDGGTTWTTVHAQTTPKAFTTVNEVFSVNLSIVNTYSTYRIIVQTITANSPDGYCAISDWRLFGY